MRRLTSLQVIDRIDELADVADRDRGGGIRGRQRRRIAVGVDRARAGGCGEGLVG